MVRVQLHPFFVELLSNNHLLNKLSQQPAEEIPHHTELIWLSEEDLCNLWKVVLKSKLYKVSGGYRVENLAWRIWYYARTRTPTSVPMVMVPKPAKAQHDSGDDWSVKATPFCPEVHSTLRGGLCLELGSTMTERACDGAIERRSTTGEAGLPSKSFVPLHEFSLLNVDSSSDESGSEDLALCPAHAQAILDHGELQKPADGMIQRRSSKKKKNVDKYLRRQVFCQDDIDIKPEVEPLHSEPSNGTHRKSEVIIKPSPELGRFGVAPPRKVSKGFNIPPKRPNSSTSTESPKVLFSSVSSDDALNLFEKELGRPSIHVPSAHYHKVRKPSFSRSASPQVARAPVSMLTILMNGQLTTSNEQQTGKGTQFMPPTRPSAPVFELAKEPIAEEVEAPLDSLRYNPRMVADLNGLERRRSSLSRTTTPKPVNVAEIHPNISIW